MASLGHAFLAAVAVAAQESWEDSEATALLATRSLLTSRRGIEECMSAAERMSFASYVTEHARDYAHGSDEYKVRQSLFETRQKDVLYHNCQPSRSWSVGVNHLTDWTDEERGSLFGWKHPNVASSGGMSLLQQKKKEAVTGDVDAIADTFLPHVNWNLTSTDNAKDQGSCGSCWAFATTNMLEAHWQIYNVGQSNMKLSMQDFVDCVPNPRKCGGTGGCKGAVVELALDYFLKNNMNHAKDNAYVARDQNRGHCNPSTGGISAAEFGLTKYHTLPKNEALPVLQALQNGPVAVALYAGPNWIPYRHGMIDGCPDTGTNINHAVLLSGYGFEEKAGTKKHYWKIVNSWGALWGEKGSVRLVRQNSADLEQKHCATDTAPQDGVECAGSEAQVTVCGTCGILYDVVAIEFNKDPVLKIADDGFAKQI